MGVVRVRVLPKSGREGKIGSKVDSRKRGAKSIYKREYFKLR